MLGGVRKLNKKRRQCQDKSRNEFLPLFWVEKIIFLKDSSCQKGNIVLKAATSIHFDTHKYHEGEI